MFVNRCIEQHNFENEKIGKGVVCKDTLVELLRNSKISCIYYKTIIYT
ncbi:hypothetical protein CSCA_5099 [Clostridium scatologenes]|uniref:Uncharacterized protein n=1 Tax=Clostridium scatologenes TaxID=1548 RepID=A0A0E3K5A5_CLOSL|nr:hypothetical protein CSCA_5099 [Clostridium scatologenes]